MYPSTNNSFHGDRVREHSAAVVNRRIDDGAEASIEAHARGGREAILRRLAKLDREWDVDRALITNFAVAGGVAFVSGLVRQATTPWWSRRRNGFFYLLSAQLGFLLLHGVVGWCPPAALFRRLGYRTTREIEAERYALLGRLDEAGA
jgi:hypothetical protein